MDKSPTSSLVRHHLHNGVINLPPGFRFHPTDEELVVQYLRRKALCFPLPASIIPEIDVHKFNPWDLPGGGGAGPEREKYFFTPSEAKYPNGSRSSRSTGCGYWKATGKDRPVVASKISRLVGFKKTLLFYQGKAPKGSRTDWIMHEYRLATTMINGGDIPARDWVLCRVSMKKRANRTDVVDGVNLLTSPSASEASCVTVAADESGGGEDISSSSPP